MTTKTAAKPTAVAAHNRYAPATAKQIAYCEGLARRAGYKFIGQAASAAGLGMAARSRMSRQDVSMVIDFLAAK